MPPRSIVYSLVLPPRSQAAPGSLVSVTLCAWPLFDSCSIVGVLAETCGEIKAIMAFSFLSWILRSSFHFERLCVHLTVWSYSDGLHNRAPGAGYPRSPTG
jgi:hypothetical protein